MALYPTRIRQLKIKLRELERVLKHYNGKIWFFHQCPCITYLRDIFNLTAEPRSLSGVRIEVRIMADTLAEAKRIVIEESLFNLTGVYYFAQKHTSLSSLVLTKCSISNTYLPRLHHLLQLFLRYD